MLLLLLLLSPSCASTFITSFSALYTHRESERESERESPKASILARADIALSINKPRGKDTKNNFPREEINREREQSSSRLLSSARLYIASRSFLLTLTLSLARSPLGELDADNIRRERKRGEQRARERVRRTRRRRDPRAHHTSGRIYKRAEVGPASHPANL